MQKSLLASIALLLMTSTATAGAPTDPACWVPNQSTVPGAPPILRWADSTQTIKVYVDVTPTSGVGNAFHDPVLVERATEIAVERWNEQAGIPQRLVFMGRKTRTTTQAADTVVIQAGGCSGVHAFATCTPSSGFGGTGFCTTGVVRLMTGPVDPGSSPVTCNTHYAAVHYTNPNNQAPLVDLLVHELGHVLGRHDSHRTDCATRQMTVMFAAQRRDLTDFDRTEMQAVYGSRAPTNVLKRRTLESVTSAWGAPVNTPIWNVDIAPAPGSSWGTDVPVTTVQFVNAVPKIIVSLFTGQQSWAGDTALVGQFPAKKPVSTSLGPNGRGVMAYIAENGGPDSTRRLCIRRRTNGVWGGETCSDPCNGRLPNNTVSTAYDPLTGRFLVAHACEKLDQTSQIRVAALATSVDCTGLNCLEVSSQVDPSPADTPVVACAPVGQAGSNCRLVYAQGNKVGQPIAWRTFGFVPGFPGQLTFGSETQTQIQSEHAPAVTYFGDAFQMALTMDGTILRTFFMFPTSSTWVDDGDLNTTGWISPPFYSTTQHCVNWGFYTTCYDNLQLFWLQYRPN